MGQTDEISAIASRFDAFDLKRMVDIGALPNVGAIKEKIENSSEFKLAQAIEDAGLTSDKKLALVGFLSLFDQSNRTSVNHE